MSTKNDGLTPDQRKAVRVAEHLLGLKVGPNEQGLVDKVVSLVLDPVGLLIRKELKHLFKPKAPVAAAKE